MRTVVEWDGYREGYAMVDNPRFNHVVKASLDILNTPNAYSVRNDAFLSGDRYRYNSGNR